MPAPRGSRCWYDLAMGALRVGLGLAAWREAWLARRDNPLPRIWQLGQARGEQRRAWWRQSPGLMWLNLAVSAAVTYLLLLLIRQFLALHESALATQSYALGLLRAGTLVLSCGEMLLGGCWLLVRLYACAYLALSLLGRTRRKGSAVLDDALLASTLSNEQVVLGLVLHAWRLLLPPVLVLNIANAAAYFIWLASPLSQGAKSQLSPLPWTQALVLALAYLLWQTILAIAGAGLLMLLLLMLGRGAGPAAPALGAAGQVVLQLWLWVVFIQTEASFGTGVLQYTYWYTGFLALLLALAGFILAAWMAHRISTLRHIVAFTLPAIVLILAAVVARNVLDPVGYPGFIGVVLYRGGWQMLSLCVAPAGSLSYWVLIDGLLLSRIAVAPPAVASCVLYALLCLPLALLARDAVRLHRGGAG